MFCGLFFPLSGWEEAIWGIVRLIFTCSLFNIFCPVFHFCELYLSLIAEYPYHHLSLCFTCPLKCEVMHILALCCKKNMYTKVVQKWVFNGIIWCWSSESLDKWWILVLSFHTSNLFTMTLMKIFFFFVASDAVDLWAKMKRVKW